MNKKLLISDHNRNLEKNKERDFLSIGNINEDNSSLIVFSPLSENTFYHSVIDSDSESNPGEPSCNKFSGYAKIETSHNAATKTDIQNIESNHHDTLRKAINNLTIDDGENAEIKKKHVKAEKKIIIPTISVTDMTEKLLYKQTLTCAQKKDLKLCAAQNEQNKYDVFVTKPVPFSFEKRDKISIKKREEMIKKTLEEEKNAREFHATPLPKYFFKSGLQKTLKHHIPLSKNKSIEKGINTFKEKHVSKEFTFNTAERSKRWVEFKKKLQMKDAQIAELEKQQKEFESYELIELRKKMVHKAQPIRHFKSVMDINPKKLTVPISPKMSFRKPVENPKKIM